MIMKQLCNSFWNSYDYAIYAQSSIHKTSLSSKSIGETWNAVISSHFLQLSHRFLSFIINVDSDQYKTIHYNALSASTSLHKLFPKEKSPGISLGNRSHYTQRKCSVVSFPSKYSTHFHIVYFISCFFDCHQSEGQFYSLLDNRSTLPKAKSSLKYKLQQLRTRSQM